MRDLVTNFSRGEFAPELYGRVDIPEYSAGAKRLRNFVIQRYGGLAFRPGFQFVGEVDDKTETYALRAFQYSVDQAYILLLGDSKMQVLAHGGFVAEDNLEIHSVGVGGATTLEIPFHDMAVGDRGYIDGVEGMVELNGRFVEVIGVPDADHITIDLSSVGFDAFVSSDGITRVGTPAPPPAPEAPPPAPPAPPTPPETTTGGGNEAIIDRGRGTGTWGARIDTDI
jgi:hypothetical protein